MNNNICNPCNNICNNFDKISMKNFNSCQHPLPQQNVILFDDFENGISPNIWSPVNGSHVVQTELCPSKPNSVKMDYLGLGAYGVNLGTDIPISNFNTNKHLIY